MIENWEFAPVLRVSIERSGLSLAEICQRLRSFGHVLSPAALSTWQSGRRQPDPVRSLGILAALEGVLDQPPDALLDLLRSSRPRGRSLRHTEIADFLPEPGPLRRAYSELGFASASSFPHERFVHQSLILDAASPVQVVTFQIMVRALLEGPCRFPAVQQFELTEPNVEPQVVPLEGCSVGQRMVWPQERTYGTEILIDRHLESGQQAFFSYQIRFPVAAREINVVNYALPRRSQDFMVEAEFRGLLPQRCERIWIVDGRRGGQEESTPIRLGAGHRLQAAESGFWPGMLGLRWQWPDDEA